MLCCAALFVASKLLYQRSQIHLYCVLYYRLKNSESRVPQPPISEAQKAEFQEKFFAMECKLLRVCDFKLDLEGCLPNMTYTKVFSRALYSYVGESAEKQVCKLAEAICNDSFFTYANLLYPVQTVSLAGVLMAASKYKYQTPL